MGRGNYKSVEEKRVYDNADLLEEAAAYLRKHS
jgi:hypothetical protein